MKKTIAKFALALIVTAGAAIPGKAEKEDHPQKPDCPESNNLCYVTVGPDGTLEPLVGTLIYPSDN